jgi:FKBP-type peptidyl-prolyl cis-trans isomerase 2
MAPKKSGKKKEARTEIQKFESLKDKAAPVKNEKINKMAQMTEKKRIEIVKDAKKGVPFKYAIAIIAVIAALAGVFIFTMPGYVRPGGTSGAAVKSGDVVQVLYTGKYENGSVFDSGNITFRANNSEVIKGFDETVMGMKTGETKTVTVKPEDAYGYPDPGKVLSIPVTTEFNRTQNITAEAFNMTFGIAPEINSTYRVQGMAWFVRVMSIRNGTILMANEPNNGTTFDLKDSLGYVYGTGAIEVKGERIIVRYHPIIGSVLTSVTALGTVNVGRIIGANETSMTIDFNNQLAGKTLTFDITLLNFIPY